MAFVAVAMQLADKSLFSQIMTRNADGSFTATTGAQTPKMLWQAAIKNAKTSCANEVGFQQVVDPVTLKTRKNMVDNATTAQQYREQLMVAFERPGSQSAKGFLMAKRDTDGIYLDVICAKRPYGTLLMQALVSRAEEDNVTLTLAALPNVLTQQPRYGFQFRQSCNDPEIQVPSELATRLAMRVASKTVPKSIDAYSDTDWKELLQFLQSNGLNVAKTPPCDDVNLDSDAIGQNYCGRDGYIMKRCKASSNNSFKVPQLREMPEAIAPHVVPDVVPAAPLSIFSQITQLWRSSPFGNASFRSEDDTDAYTVVDEPVDFEPSRKRRKSEN